MSDDDKKPSDECGDDYEVGYCSPPKHTRFQPGQSGNPKGRPKGSKSFSRDLDEELSETVSAREFGRQKKLSKRRAILKAQVAKAIAGDTRAAIAVFNMARELLPEDLALDAETPTTADDEMILRMYHEALETKPEKEN